MLLNAYMRIVEKFAAAHNKSYPMSGPIFVNKNLTAFKTSTRSVNYGLFRSVTGVAGFLSHDARRMFGTYCGSSKSLIIREAAALASNHRYRLEG